MAKLTATDVPRECVESQDSLLNAVVPQVKILKSTCAGMSKTKR